MTPALFQPEVIMGLLMKQHLGMMGTKVTPATHCVIRKPVKITVKCSTGKEGK